LKVERKKGKEGGKRLDDIQIAGGVPGVRTANDANDFSISTHSLLPTPEITPSALGRIADQPCWAHLISRVCISNQ
jgi:hypothetical protein